jgi:hypothetical protein
MQGGAQQFTVATNSLLQWHLLAVSRLCLHLGRATAIGRGHSAVRHEPNHAMAMRVKYTWLSFRQTLMGAITQGCVMMQDLFG